jgi:hypothetical protein
MINQMKFMMGRLLSLIFLSLSLFLIGLAVFQFIEGFNEGKEIVNILIQSVNTSIIAMAIFELGIGIGKEYGNNTDDEDHTYIVMRRTISRFVGTVCIALVLEGLIMIIKYSQLDLAGNLFYPVGILLGASVLLASMGLFLQLTRADCEKLQSKLKLPLVRHLPNDNQSQPQRRRAVRRRD